ncbi:50S ribosomal protein L39e [Candidatus Marsarchaeota archaeon]|jgi:ribosomal protein L39E|nr:50S ribosomal protein L39e [Candidatus Marsarchaeota archaeon]MCL5092113.1 50S ribosomal protein L39e [Candidatus Marsarchaeota archaeon]
MSKKDLTKKRRLGKQIKRARRIPLLATLRTHRSIQFNMFNRDWRKTKLRSKMKV